MRFHYYHKDTGELHAEVVATNIADHRRALKFAQMNAPHDHIPVKGNLDRKAHRIDVSTGLAVAI
jgi:hypothetical protein